MSNSAKESWSELVAVSSLLLQLLGSAELEIELNEESEDNEEMELALLCLPSLAHSQKSELTFLLIVFCFLSLSARNLRRQT